MALLEKTRDTMNAIFVASPNLKVGRKANIQIMESACNYEQELINFSGRQKGSFTFTYVISYNPTNSMIKASAVYDSYIQTFEEQFGKWKDYGLVLLSYEYGQSEQIVDSEDASVSIIFNINIVTTERK